MGRWMMRVVALVALFGLAGLSSSGLSLAADVVTITSPSDGGSFQAPYSGPFSVDIASGSQNGTYTMDVTGPGGYAWQTTWSYDGSQTSNSWPITAIEAAGTYRATVTAPDSTVDATSTFTVTPAPLVVDSASVSVSPFYPLEVDGYRDSTVFRFQTNLAATDTITIRNRYGQRVRRVQLGRLSGGATHGFLWKGKKDTGKMATPGTFTIRLVATRAGVTVGSAKVAVSLRARPATILGESVSPQAFYPKPDGYRDYTHVYFTTSYQAADTIRVINSSGHVVRSASLGLLSGRHLHSWKWGGHSNSGRPMPRGTYRINVTTLRYSLRVVGPWRAVILRRPSSGPPNCTPGYSPCLVDHGGADYDCYGGSGNGPYYTARGVVYTVTGSDPYRLDADHDGLGCESG